MYLSEPTSQYAQLGVPKQGVHLIPPPLELCLDARGVGGEGRWVRSGCHPNAVLRPVVCGRRGQTRASSAGGGSGGEEEEDGDDDDGEPQVTFGVFAIRDVKADEEIVLGWEWDDRHVVHELPRLLREGYATASGSGSGGGGEAGSGSSGLKRAMGEVLSTLFSTFTTCACGESAHDCAIAQMRSVVGLDRGFEPAGDELRRGELPPGLDSEVRRGSDSEVRPPHANARSHLDLDLDSHHDLNPDLDADADAAPDPDLLPPGQQQHRTSNMRDQHQHQYPYPQHPLPQHRPHPHQGSPPPPQDHAHSPQRPAPHANLPSPQQYRTHALPLPNLGPLVGATRGLRTTDRGQGGRTGVEVVPSNVGSNV
ncbi:hypothetical protein K439DRAFT_1382415, partial [Ramaria rubella]